MRFTGAVDEAPILSIASAATTNIGAARANMLSISGGATISSFGTASSGVYREVIFEGVLTLTYNASSMLLPGLQSITTASGDTAGFVSLGSGSWRCVWYQRATGVPLVERAGSGVAVSTTTGVSIDITGIPPWAREVQVVLAGISTNGSSLLLAQLGTSSGVITSGYASWAMTTQGAAVATGSSSVGFLLSADHNSAMLLSGILSLANVSGNTWVGSLGAGENNGGNNRAVAGGGQVSLPALLDRIRLTTVNGTDQLDAGLLNIIYRA